MLMILLFVLLLVRCPLLNAMERNEVEFPSGVITRRPERAHTVPTLCSPRNTSEMRSKLKNLEELVSKQGKEIERLQRERGIRINPLTGSVAPLPESPKEMTVDEIKAGLKKDDPRILINQELDEKERLARENSLLKKVGGGIIGGLGVIAGLWWWSQKEGNE